MGGGYDDAELGGVYRDSDDGGKWFMIFCVIVVLLVVGALVVYVVSQHGL